MTDIHVSQEAEDTDFVFDVAVEDRGSTSKHEVLMKKSFYADLKTDTPPEKIVVKSFEFLLEREPKESILSSFDIEVISKYFPEYKEAVKGF